MKMINRFLIITVFLIFAKFELFASDTLKVAQKEISIQEKLNSLSSEVEALNKRIDISVPDASIQEFLRAVANLSGLNINVSPLLNIKIVNNFSNVRVADLLNFLCVQYNLRIKIIGNIIDLYQEPIPVVPREAKINFEKDSFRLSIDSKSIPLFQICRQITVETGLNIIPAPEVYNEPITFFIYRQNLDVALQNLGKANKLSVNKGDDGSYFVDKEKGPSTNLENNSTQNQSQIDYSSHRNQRNSTNQNNQRNNRNQGNGDGQNFELEINLTDNKKLNIHAVDAPLDEILKEASKKAGINYLLTSEIKGNVTMELTDVTFEELMNGLFVGKEFNFLKKADTYYVGDKKISELKIQRAVQFFNRPIISSKDSLPKHLTDNMDITDYKDLNTYIVNGSLEKVNEFENFCRQIDKKVPVIMIEVMIVDLKKTNNFSTGIEAGLGKAPESSTGKIFPELDVKLSTKAINNIIDKFNGIGVGNLGHVSKEFYLNIKALENEGVVDIKSTPVLSTLNGHQALLNIGQTEYYLTEQSNITTGQNSVVSTSKNYQNVEAKLEVKITPFVSGDEYITMNIEVMQSNFTERIDKFAPPGNVKREFKSKIRIKDQDMILLGGLEEASKRESGNGVPFLQRIPVIKWFFSSRSKQKSDAQLTIFIKPTIIG